MLEIVKITDSQGKNRESSRIHLVQDVISHFLWLFSIWFLSEFFEEQYKKQMTSKKNKFNFFAHNYLILFRYRYIGYGYN